MQAVRVIAIWVAILRIAVVNGAFREFALVPRVGVAIGRVVSTLWLMMIVLFGFSFRRYRGNSLETLFADYNFLNGRGWLLVPVTTFFAPLVIARARGLFAHP